MSVTIVNDYFFKPDVPEVELSLWLEARDNPLHQYHITVFSDPDVMQKVRESEAIKRFTGRLYPHIDHSTFVSPLCEVRLADGKGVKPVN